jgi:hypothetical protein
LAICQDGSEFSFGHRVSLDSPLSDEAIQLINENCQTKEKSEFIQSGFFANLEESDFSDEFENISYPSDFLAALSSHKAIYICRFANNGQYTVEILFSKSTYGAKLIKWTNASGYEYEIKNLRCNGVNPYE